MLVKMLNHFRLTGRLLKDRRVKIWLKVALIILPMIYAVIPFAIEIPDFVPVIGLLDDFAVLGFATIIFNAVGPAKVVQEHMQQLQGVAESEGTNLEIYRYPEELRNLGIGLVVGAVILLVAGMAAGFIWLLLFGMGYLMTGIGRARLLANAVQCSPTQLPELNTALQAAQADLPPVRVNMFVTQNPVLNAYTFGYREPYSIVLTSGLVEKLTPEEIQAVIGHELGHIHFNHVILINLMSMSITGIERLIFFLWSRSCEYTADAVALHTSANNPKPMVSALLKLASGLNNISVDLDEFMAQVETGDKNKVSGKAEMLSTHPFINNRIKRLIQIAREKESIRQTIDPEASERSLVPNL